MLTKVLPSSSAPISRSRFATSRLTLRGGAGAVLFQLVHAAAGDGGQRGFGAGEEGRNHQQQDDGDERW